MRTIKVNMAVRIYSNAQQKRETQIIKASKDIVAIIVASECVSAIKNKSNISLTSGQGGV